MCITSSGGMLTANAGSEVIVELPEVLTRAALLAPKTPSQPPQMFGQT